jgi:hypothetical protein
VTEERQRVIEKEKKHKGNFMFPFFFFMMDAVGAGAVGWGIDCDYSALRKEGRGKQSIASWPAVPPDSCPSIVVGGGARHMVDSHFQFCFLFLFL